jgi:hypothetical protein
VDFRASSDCKHLQDRRISIFLSKFWHKLSDECAFEFDDNFDELKAEKWMNVKDDDHHLNHYICGRIAGGLASIPSTPFDIIKTRLNTQADLNK